MNNQPIGIIDSGVGGLSVWQEVNMRLPHESIMYIADSKNCPYGTKSPPEIYQLSQRLIKFLLEKEVKLVVIACNTITVSCLDQLRRDFPSVPIVGTVPVVKTAVERSMARRIGVLSTTATAHSHYQKQLIENFAKDCSVLNIGTDKLVPFVEKGVLQGLALQKILEEVLTPFQKGHIDVLALGCTHFPFLKESIQQILGKDVLILSSGAAIARQVERVLMLNNMVSSHQKNDYIFYTTATASPFLRLKNILIGKQGGEAVAAIDL